MQLITSPGVVEAIASSVYPVQRWRFSGLAVIGPCSAFRDGFTLILPARHHHPLPLSPPVPSAVLVLHPNTLPPVPYLDTQRAFLHGYQMPTCPKLVFDRSLDSLRSAYRILLSSSWSSQVICACQCHYGFLR